MKMIKKTLAFFALLFATCIYAPCQFIRPLAFTQEITRAQSEAKWVVFFQGESVSLTLKELVNGNAYSIPTNAIVRWDICSKTNVNLVYLSVTGTISVATNGTSAYVAAPSNTLIAAGAYNGFVKLFQYDAATNLYQSAVLQYQNVQVQSTTANNGNSIVPIQPYVAAVVGAGATSTNNGIVTISAGAGSANSITGNQYNAILGGLTVSNVLQISTNPAITSTNTGSIYWDTAEHTLSMPMEGGHVVQQVGMEMYIYGQNKFAGTISNGTPVRITTDIGGTTPRFDKASATNGATKGHFVGVATDTIGQNGYGYVTACGVVHDLNTAAWNNGDDLFLDGDGSLTNQAAAFPSASTHVGYVIRSHASQGSIYVMQGMPEMDPYFQQYSNSIAVLSTDAVQTVVFGTSWSKSGTTLTINTNAGGGGSGTITNIVGAGGITVTSGGGPQTTVNGENLQILASNAQAIANAALPLAGGVLTGTLTFRSTNCGYQTDTLLRRFNNDFEIQSGDLGLCMGFKMDGFTNYLFSQGAVVGTFQGSGTLLTDLNASALASGTIPVGVLGSNVARKVAANGATNSPDANGLVDLGTIGGSAGAVTNGGATINGSVISNGAAITVGGTITQIVNGAASAGVASTLDGVTTIGTNLMNVIVIVTTKNTTTNVPALSGTFANLQQNMVVAGRASCWDTTNNWYIAPGNGFVQIEQQWCSLSSIAMETRLVVNTTATVQRLAGNTSADFYHRVSFCYAVTNGMKLWLQATGSGGIAANNATVPNNASWTFLRADTTAFIDTNRIYAALLIGQSNMNGPEVATLGLPPDPYTNVYYGCTLWGDDQEEGWTGLRSLQPNGRWGCELTFGRAMAGYWGTGKVSVCKIAYPGTTLGVNWQTNGATWAWFKSNLANFKANNTEHPIQWVAIGWAQGEGDAAVSALANAYATNLPAFFNNVGIELGNTNVPIGVYILPSGEGDLYASTVRNAQGLFVSNNSARAFALPSFGYAMRDSQHITTNAVLAMGNDFYNGFTNFWTR